MKKYKCESIGAGQDSKYETMVFKARKDSSKCCPYSIDVSEDQTCIRAATADEATKIHYKMCKKYDRKGSK